MPFKSLKAISTIIKGANSPESNEAYEAQNHLAEVYRRLEPQVPAGKSKEAMTRFITAKDNFKDTDPKNNNSAGETLWIQTLNILAADTASALPFELKQATERSVAAEEALSAVVDRRIAGLSDKDLAQEIKAEDKQLKTERKEEKKEQKAIAREERGKRKR